MSSNFTSPDMSISYEVITPVASYVALAFVVITMLLIISAKLVITVDTTKSDLVIYNTHPQKLELLVSKQTSNSGAMNNIHSAVALGLMEPPPNYQPPKPTANHNLMHGGSSKGFAHSNGFAHSSMSSQHTNNVGAAAPLPSAAANNVVTDQVEGEPVRRKKNLKF